MSVARLGSLPAGCAITWYRFFRFNGHRFNEGVVVAHLNAGVTRFATPINDNKVLVVPMSSDLRVRVCA